MMLKLRTNSYSDIDWITSSPKYKRQQMYRGSAELSLAFLKAEPNRDFPQVQSARKCTWAILIHLSHPLSACLETHRSRSCPGRHCLIGTIGFSACSLRISTSPLSCHQCFSCSKLTQISECSFSSQIIPDTIFVSFHSDGNGKNLPDHKNI